MPEDRLGNEVVDELLRLVLVHRDLLEHDLALEVHLGEERRVDHVAHHVDRLVEVVVCDARVDGAVLAEVAAFSSPPMASNLGDLLRCTARCL